MTRPFLPYGRHSVSEADIEAVVEVLKSDWLTTGPTVERFEHALADFAGARHAVAVSSGTAALHAAMFALGIGPGDEVIVPPMTFAATANAVLYMGGVPVFADVEETTLLIDPALIEARITPRTKAIIAVDYAGQPCDYKALRVIADRHGLALVADACHSLGAEDQAGPCGSLADLTAFSFHPVKPVTTAEGGMVTTDHLHYAQRMQRFRNHGITTDHRQRTETGAWFYEMIDLGFNYRLSDLQCALGLSQLKKLPEWLKSRRKIAERYDKDLRQLKGIEPLKVRNGVVHGYHLYVVRISEERRDPVFTALRNQGIGVNVHYVPVYLHPYYRDTLGFVGGLCPVAEAAYPQILSLPVFPAMTDDDVERVVEALEGALSR